MSRTATSIHERRRATEFEEIFSITSHFGANTPSRAVPRKIKPLAIRSSFTAGGKGGKLNVMVGPRGIHGSVVSIPEKKQIPRGPDSTPTSVKAALVGGPGLVPLVMTKQMQTINPHRSGVGIMARLRWPLASTARTAKHHVVLRERQSRPRDIADGLRVLPVGRCRVAPQHFVAGGQSAGRRSHTTVESFCSSFVNRRTLAGGAGADASDASVAAFSRATLAV